MGNFLEGIAGILAITLSLGTPLFAIFLALYGLKTKHKENMELIRQGIIPPSKNKSAPNLYRSLRNGFLCIGIGLGIIVDIIVNFVYDVSTIDSLLILGGSVLLLLGIAYVAFYLAVRKKQDLDNDLDND